MKRSIAVKMVQPTGRILQQVLTLVEHREGSGYSLAGGGGRLHIRQLIARLFLGALDSAHAYVFESQGSQAGGV